MGRNVGPKCRLCRREGEKLFLKGEKCYTEKCPVSRRSYPPGVQHRSRRQSLYGDRLREKQKTKHIYGTREGQFLRYVQMAKRSKAVAGTYLLQLLERRLDSTLYRAGLASSHDQARQLINHGHIWVNGRRVDIASWLTRPGDEIAVKESSAGKTGLKAILAANAKRSLPSWLERQNGTVRVLELPHPKEIEQALQMNLVVEFYSR
ncbi:MAG TPA: 30S ribosomal protein S4 [Candidatus Fraserbacteria bacterium]|nr:30S ribosomal protein S4 [Candidatus Fraserbacteria bacterium]